MGLDRFATFISKSINGNGIEELNINDNIRKIISNHIIFDLNFLIYQEIIEIENEINDIIKIILCLPFSLEKNGILEELLKTILTQEHWKPYYIETNFENLFDGFNEDEIIQKFIKFITSKISLSNSNLNDKDFLTILNLVTFEKIINVLTKNIENIHYIPFIQSISIFFDGIPSLSKVIEQRKRRIKNHLESSKKKELFKKYFDTLKNNNKNVFENLSKKYIETEHNICFNYFKWIKNRFSIDKSFGPSSKFIEKLELFMNTNIRQKFPKKKIFINSATENGESDIKIFKYISTNEINGDYCIHTTDSDLIHQILVQQAYYKTINKDINFTVIKYIKNYTNNLKYVQVLESDLIIKNILDLYNNINGLKTNNYKIVWDLCLIFYFFGNDNLPSSVEIGPELGLDFFIKGHFQSLNKNNIINIKKSHIIMDLPNFNKYLEKINETKTQNITRIILQRFFKININVVNLFVDKLELDFNNLLIFLEIFITRLGKEMNSEIFNLLDDYDLRKQFVQSNKSSDFLSLGFNDNKIKITMENIHIITENISFYEHEFNGLVLYTRPQNITKDPYQDLYNYISDKASQYLSKKYPIYYDYIDIYQHLKILENLGKDSNQNSNDYLKKIYHLVSTQFGNMSQYHSNNITFYKYLNMPSIDNLINYIKEQPQDTNKTKDWLSEIQNENISSANYFNSTNHHLIITPFISFYNIPIEIKKIISHINCIDNLWIEDIDNFNYRSIDIVKFFKLWNESIAKSNTDNLNDNLELV
jgi:hypothetical protein